MVLRAVWGRRWQNWIFLSGPLSSQDKPKAPSKVSKLLQTRSALNELYILHPFRTLPGSAAVAAAGAPLHPGQQAAADIWGSGGGIRGFRALGNVRDSGSEPNLTVGFEAPKMQIGIHACRPSTTARLPTPSIPGHRLISVDRTVPEAFSLLARLVERTARGS